VRVHWGEQELMAAPFMHSQPASELEALGHFSASLRLTDVPQPTVALAKLAMLNIIGGILVSDHPVLNPGRQSLLRYVQRQGAAPRARILGTRERTSPELASLVTSGSAMMAHGDDWSWPARTHLSAVVFPATLAMAEAHCSSGAELLCAFIAGTEVGVRIGSAILPVSGRKIPFTSPVHALATAASAASIMQLDASRAALGLSIATDMGTGLIAQAPRQHVVLRTPLGGSLGLYAAGVAAEGIEGRLDVLPTFCSIYGDYHAQQLLQGLGQDFLFGQHGFLPKRFHFSTGLYPTIHGIERGLAREPIDVDQITAIECRCSPALRQVYGAAPDHSREMTHFSLRLGIALALTGSAFRYEDVATLPHADESVRRLSQLVQLTAHPELQDQVNLGRAAEPTQLLVHMRSGALRQFDSHEYPAVQHPEQDRQRVLDLFLQRALPRLGALRAQQVIEAIDGIDGAPSLDRLLDPLTPDP